MTEQPAGCTGCLSLSMQIVRLRAEHRRLVEAVDGLEAAIRTYRRARELEVAGVSVLSAELELFAAHDQLARIRKGNPT